MPLIQTIRSEKSFYGIWQLTENVEMLSQMLRYYGMYKVPGHYTHLRRIAEWHAVRLILHELLPFKHFDIYYDEYGKPFLASPNGFISISHTHGYVGVMYHQSANCGFDLELIDERIASVASKFLREDEMTFVANPDALKKTYVVWSAKEVIYKLYGKKSLDFKKNLRVMPFQLQHTGQVDGLLILNKDICPYLIQYTFHEQLLISSSVAQ
jgi:phosphopantetheinyl transferase